jgi:predicted branched-subunit amino acid permease
VRPLAAHWVIDETSVVALTQPGRRAARIGFTVTGACLYLMWNVTTLLGAVGAGALGDTEAWGLDAAGPAVFLALLAPMLRTGVERVTAGGAVVLGLGLLPVLPSGLPVLLAALAAPLVLLLHGWRSEVAGKSAEPGDAAGRMEAGESEQTGEGVR